MIKKICLLIFCFFSTTVLATEEKPMTSSQQDKSEALLKASRSYIAFSNRVGSGDVFPQLDEAATLVAPGCKKFFNGRLVNEKREDFVADLLSVYNNHGGWKVIPVDIIDIPLHNSAVLQLIIETENFGTNIALVILRYDSSGLITEINEVFSPIQDSYDFKKK